MTNETKNNFIPEAHKQLKGIERNLLELKYQIKQRELDLKLDFANKYNLRNKKNEIDTKVIKFALYELALKIVFGNEEKIPLEEKLEILYDYVNKIKENKIDKEIVESYFRNKVEVQEIKKNELKEIDCKYGGLIQKEDYSTIKEIIKLEIKSEVEDKENKFRKDNDLPTKKTKTPKEENNLEKLKEISKQIGINIENLI